MTEQCNDHYQSQLTNTMDFHWVTNGSVGEGLLPGADMIQTQLHP